MMLLQVSEEEWAVVMLNEATGQVDELRVDAATAQQVQAGALTPDALTALLAAQQAGDAAQGGGEEGG